MNGEEAARVGEWSAVPRDTGEGLAVPIRHSSEETHP